MQHLITPYEGKHETWAFWENGFSNEELDVLQQIAKQAQVPAQIGRGEDGQVDPNVRRTKVQWVDKSRDNEWFFQRMSHIASALNAQCFNFTLTGFAEAAQFCNYSSADEGTYSWHQDFGSSVSRKLSLVLLLSNPESYEGGALQVLTKAEPETLPNKRGTVLVFPAWTLHRVTPVIHGERQSVVLWAAGDPFR